MSRPPISRSNSSSSLEQTNTEQINQSTNKTPKTEKGKNPPTVSNKPEPQTPFDRIFNTQTQTQTKRDDLDDESDNGGQPQQEKSSQGDQQKSSGKPANTPPKGKAASSNRKVVIPSLKLGGSSGVAPGTARLKSRAPVSPDSTSGLGSHRAMSPRTGDANQPNSSSSASTPSTNTQGQASSSAPPSTPPARSLPPIPQTPSSQTPPVSTSNVPASARGATSVASNEKGVPASILSTASQKILDAAVVHGIIDPAALGYLMVEVQTASFTLPATTFSQGVPFLRGGLKVLNFTASNGKTIESINLIEKFLQPLAEEVFNTPECNELRKTVQKNYLSVASSMEAASKGMRPKEMQESEKIKNIMDSVIHPITLWVCGEDENLATSQLPQVWKSMMLGIDLAVVHWLKNSKCNDMKEIKSLRSEAMIAFISTRGYMMIWGNSIKKYGDEHNFDSAKLNTYMNSYFSHRAEKFITDIMLSRDDVKGDKFDSRIRGYLSVLSGRKEFISKVPKENTVERRQLMKSKTLHSTKSPPTNSSNRINDESVALSPRMLEKEEVEKTREIKQKQRMFQRQKFVRDFSKLANLAIISPEFFKAFQTHVVKEMSDRAYEKFEQDPIQLCSRYLDKFYVGVLNKERQAAEKSIRSALAAIKSEDIKALAPAAEKVKGYVKPDPKISKERREQFLGNFYFYTGIHELSRDFLKSFGSYINELSRTEYVKFEENPIPVCLAYVDKFYSSLVTTTIQSANDTAAKQKEFVTALKNISPNSLEGLRKSMAIPSKLVSDVLDGVKADHVNLEFPANPFEEDEKQENLSPTTTASTLALQDSRTPSGATVDVKPVQQNEITAQRRNDFLNQFFKMANIQNISDDFDAVFKKHILELSTIDYVKFLDNPIDNCREYVNYFYALPVHQQTKESRAAVYEDQPTFLTFLKLASEENLEAINKLAASNLAPTSTASTTTSTASTQPPQGTRVNTVASVRVNPVAKEIESEKTELSSEPEIVTESDSDADDAASESEKTEES